MAFTSQKDEEFFGAIGRLALSWSLMEFGLDSIVGAFYYDLSGREIEVEIPWSLKRKIKFIRKCFGRLITVDSINQTAKDLMDDIEAASEMRHDILHGVPVEQFEGAGVARMVRLLRGGERYASRAFTINTTAILAGAQQANVLAHRTLRLATLLQNTIRAASKEIDKP